MQSPTKVIQEIEWLIRRDPANRGLIGSDAVHGPLCGGHLAAAAVDLAENAAAVGIVTGFFVPRAALPAAETDGPPGALMLAHALAELGVEVTLLTDEACVPVVRAAAAAGRFDPDSVVVCPDRDRAWRKNFLSAGRGGRFTHLISIERPGPAHTPESLALQERAEPVPLENFAALVPPEARNCCHNMLGQNIDDFSADLWRLFDELPQYRPRAKTIGIGDGGNEIGMGTIPWEDLQRRLEGEQAARIPCRIACDWTIIAGTSNWGGYALAAALLLLRGRVDALLEWDAERERDILDHLVQVAGAVDGVTARRQPTVDGLPPTTYIQPWIGIRRLLGLE